MPRCLGLLAATALLSAALVGCSSPEASQVECSPARSTLSAIDPGTGAVAWRADLSRASELPVQVSGGSVVVTAPCGAAVVDLSDGRIRYDGPIPGEPVGVADDQLFVVGERSGGSTPVEGLVLRTGRTGDTFSSNTSFEGATVADGSLVTLYDGMLEATSLAGGGPSWRTGVPAWRNARLATSGRLVLVTGSDGSTSAVDLADGALLWRTVPPVAAASYALEVTSVPGTVLTAATTETGRTFAYATDSGSGRLHWTRPDVAVLAADRDLTLLGTAHGLEAVDTTTGAVRWRRPDRFGQVRADGGTVALTDSTLVVPQPGSPALGLDRETGRVRWRGPDTRAATAAGDVVVVPTVDGITAVDARTGATRWTLATRRDFQEITVAPDGRLLLLDSDVVPHLGA